MEPEQLSRIEEQVWKEIGAALCERRLALGLTQERLVERMPSTPQTLGRREHGRASSPEYLAAWASALGVDG